MVKKYALENLDCQNCANKIEENLKMMDGVNDVKVNFFTQEVKVDWQEAPNDDNIDNLKNIVSKVEPSCKVVL